MLYSTERYEHDDYHRRDYYYDRPRDYYYRRYDDLLIYELMRERDRYRDLYLDQLYDVDACNPYYAEVSGCRR